MNIKFENILVMLGWSIITSFIILSSVYQKFLEPMTIKEVILVFAVSLLTGILLVDPETIMLSYIGSLVITTLTLYTSLTLPASLIAIANPSLRAVLMEGAIGIVTRIVLIVVVVPCLVGSFLGGMIGEMMRVR